MSKSNSFKKSRKLALGIAVAMGCSFAAVAFADGAIVAPTGVTTNSTATSVSATNNMIAGGQWLPNIGAAVSASGNNTVLNMNLGENTLTVNGYGSSHSTGIAAIDKGVVNINNPGAMSVAAESTGGGQTAALFVNSGGKIFVNNASTSGGKTLEAQRLTMTGSTTNSTNGAVVKAMNGVNGTRSYIKIDGLVDINADTTDGVGMSEAVSAVASTIDIGGGNIIATKNGVNPGLNYGFAENCAIRAYGEFVSSNYGIVNVNVTKESDALDAKAIGAGNNKTVIAGDLNTVGGMGTKGTINVGLNTADSYWNGNYIKGAGWGETPGDYGSVNLFMGKGAKWIGNASFATNVKMSGANTAWQGYSLNNAVSAEITNGAAWYNYNTEDTTALRSLTGSDSYDNTGFVYMTPFTKNVNNQDVTYNTGNVTVANYSGHMKVLYGNNGTEIIGGNFTIGNASENSAIRLVIDSDSINMNDEDDVTTALNNLANKLYYQGYADGERNLDGTVMIAEGLTNNGASLSLASTLFNNSNGQASFDSFIEEDSMRLNYYDVLCARMMDTFDSEKNTFYDKGINGATHSTHDGSIKTEQYYLDNGVYNEENDTYVFADKNVQLNVKNNVVNSSYISSKDVYAGISADRNSTTNIDLNGNNLDLNVSSDKEKYGVNGILAVGSPYNTDWGNVEIKNAGAVNINVSSETANYTYGISASGKVLIHNGGDGLENKVLKISATDKNGNGCTGIGVSGVVGQTPTVVIDGLVDIQGMKEAVFLNDGIFEAAGGKFEGSSNAININGNKSKVSINVCKDEAGNVIGGSNNVVQIDGPIKNASGTLLNLGLNGSESYFNGNFTGSGKSTSVTSNGNVTTGINLFMDNGSKWAGNFASTIPLALRMHNGSIWEGGSSSVNMSKARPLSLTIDTGSLWKTNGNPIGVKYFTGGKTEAERGYVDMTTVKETDSTIYKGEMVIDNYAGNTMFFYGRDSEYPTRVLGGNITIGSAAEGSVITLSTDNDGLDTSNAGEVSKVLNKLANKLTYTGAIDGAENNLDGYVQIAEGLTASSAALKLGDINFSAEDGKGSLKEGSIITPENKKNPEVIYGDKETAMMKGAKTAMASAALLWRAENNDLMKRMGDLRLSEDESGIWAKYYGGKYSMDAQNTDLNLKYNAYQVGYDKEVGNGWKAGVALSYNDGNSSYGNGRADIKGTSLGLYGTWQGDSGQYLDLIAKYTRLENEFDVRNAYGHKLNGDYKTWGASLSAEYGKRFEGKNGLYVDPSLELTVGRIAAKDYAATSDYLSAWGKNKNMDVAQDAFTSCIARLGVRVGQTTDNASYFVKLAAAHEFSGDFDSAFRAVGEQGGKTSLDFGDTWYEAQVGVTAKLSAANTFYATYGCSFGGDVEQKYRLDAGLRWSF